jgi:hypothetical protein
MGRDEDTLTVIYSAERASPNPTSRPIALMPLLVLLFVISYSILTALVFEQGRTIESQRGLIREMLKDSTQLAALKGKAARDDGRRAQDKDKATAGADHNSGNEAAEAKGPDAKGSDKTKRPGQSTHGTKEVPHQPSGDLEDVRRSTGVI